MAVVYVPMYFKCKICFTVYTGETKINDTYLLTYLLTYLWLVSVFIWFLHFLNSHCRICHGIFMFTAYFKSHYLKS